MRGQNDPVRTATRDGLTFDVHELGPPEGDPVLILLPPIHTFPWLAAGPRIMLGYIFGRLLRTYPFNPVAR